MRKRIGDFLIEKGVLNQAQLNECLSHARETGLRIGEAALDLGIIKKEQLVDLFGPNWTVDYFHLDPSMLPPATRELIPVEAMVRLGAIPLGYKESGGFLRSRKILNVGMVNPSRADALQEIEMIARRKLGDGVITGTKVYLILADQLLTVLEQVYGMPDAQIAELVSKSGSKVDDTLELFLS